MDFAKEVLQNDTHPREDYENLRLVLCADQESVYVKYFKFEDVSDETIITIDIHSGERNILWTDSDD